MRFTYGIRTAIGALRTNALRSTLTILGVVIGIAAIILLMAVGRGAENLILDQVRAFGSDVIFVEPGREPKGPTDFVEVFTDSLKVRDVSALRRPVNVPDVAVVSPALVQVTSVAHGQETYRAQVHGHDEHFADVFDVTIDAGTPISADDVASRARVAVIGSKVRAELFGAQDPIGATVQIKGVRFRVIGTLPPKGRAAFVPYDELVVLPYTTMQEYLLGIDYFHMIAVQVRLGANVARAKHDITLTLREQHGITDPEKDDFHVMTQEDAVARIGVISTALTALLVAIAAISLIVGGIGIMNIMLVAVAERTREIGLRKALGARDRDIRQQFLWESVALTVTGGAIGVTLGAAFAFLTAFILQRTVASGWSFTFPVSAAVLGLVVAGVIGIVFGLYPARLAARKSPMEALRFE